MNEAPVWKVSKWPFLVADALLILVAGVLIHVAARPISLAQVYLSIGCVALGALLGCLPFLLDYFAVTKMMEVNAVSSAAGQLHDLKEYSARISEATERWAQVQEATRSHAEKTVTAAGEIAQRMTQEIRDFNDFQVKLNDTEKGALRLEVEKLRRSEAEWLQVLARVLDHIFALYNAASRSGNTDLAEQISHFQNACRDAARRVGLVMFGAVPEEKFDPQKHRVHGVETQPADGTIAEMLAPGMTFQGRLLRPVLVRLHDPAAPKTDPAATHELALESNS